MVVTEITKGNFGKFIMIGGRPVPMASPKLKVIGPRIRVGPQEQAPPSLFFNNCDVPEVAIIHKIGSHLERFA
jgi:hypothetical protein